jgi:hypothetical protein
MATMVCIRFVCTGYMVYYMILVYNLIRIVLGFDFLVVYYLSGIAYADSLSYLCPSMIYSVIVIVGEDMIYCFVVNICYLVVCLAFYCYFDLG